MKNKALIFESESSLVNVHIYSKFNGNITVFHLDLLEVKVSFHTLKMNKTSLLICKGIQFGVKLWIFPVIYEMNN